MNAECKAAFERWQASTTEPLDDMTFDEELALHMWNAAIAEAAKVCDSVNNHDNPMTARDCADAIRTLREQSMNDKGAEGVALEPVVGPDGVRERMKTNTIQDDMCGLYPCASDAMRAGERSGADYAWARAIHVAAQVSVEMEGTQHTQAFHTAERICRLLVKARDKHREKLAIEQERAHAESH